MNSDLIIIKGLELWCNIGIGEKERTITQKIILDVTLEYDTTNAGKNDDIRQTINYALVCKDIKELMRKEYHTIEHLAHIITNHVKEHYPVISITVYIKKPAALAREGARYAAIKIQR